MCLLLCLLSALLPLSAQAGFSDAWTALETSENGMTVSVSGLEVTWLNTTDSSLTLLNGLLSPLSVRFSAGPAGDFLALSDEDSGKEIIASAGKETDQALPYPAGLTALRRLWEQRFPALFEYLSGVSGEEPPEVEEKSTYFNVLGSSPARQSLTVSREQFALLPPSALQPFLNDLKAVFAGSRVHDDLSGYLDQMTLESEMVFHRNLDGNGQDMAYQLGGRIGSGGADIRKLTFVIGRSGDIFYFSVKAPAVRGGNSFQAVMNVPKWSTSRGKVSRDCTFTVKTVKGNDTRTTEDTLRMECRKGTEEAVTLRLDREEKHDGITENWQFSLKLDSAPDGSLSGTLSGWQKHAASYVVKWSSRVSVTPGQPALSRPVLSRGQAAGALLELLAMKRNALSYKDQRQLDHLLRTDAWMNGPNVPPIPAQQETEE